MMKRNKKPKIDKAHKKNSYCRKFYKVLLGILFDAGIALLILVIIFGSIYAYTQNWPPLVVIESNSMMHSDDSAVGIIDTGDLVFVKRVYSHADIITYFEGKKIGYKTYGDYGDVIIYRKNGKKTLTPVIHRVILWLEFNNSDYDPVNLTGGSFDIPSLNIYGLKTTFTIKNFGYNNQVLTIPINKILDNFFIKDLTGRRIALRTEPHSGYITKGDHNQRCDQVSLLVSSSLSPSPFRVLVEPIKLNWIVGKAVGELPWFGLIKLYTGGELNGEQAPPTSVTMLIITLISVISLPFVVDIIIVILIRVKTKKKEKEKGRRQGATTVDVRRKGGVCNTRRRV